jgi:signal transduction histidine kinase
LESDQENESTGIGLSIVKNIIEEMGGSISVESKLNKGSTFKFHWPIKQKVNLDKTKA